MTEGKREKQVQSAICLFFLRWLGLYPGKEVAREINAMRTFPKEAAGPPVPLVYFSIEVILEGCSLLPLVIKIQHFLM